MRHTLLLSSLAALVLLNISACVRLDPTNSVTVEVINVTSGKSADEILRSLKGTLDPDGYSRVRSSYKGTTLTVDLEPVKDVEDFSKRITFGRVVSVKDRTVKIIYGSAGEFISI